MLQCDKRKEAIGLGDIIPKGLFWIIRRFYKDGLDQFQKPESSIKDFISLMWIGK